jgi:hypothetical protein
MKVTTVAILGSSRCSEEFVRNVSAYGKRTRIIERVSLKNLPEILENVEGLIPGSVLNADVVLDFSNHPDIPYALKSARRVITTSRCSLPNVLVVDCFCAVDISEEFGIPEFEIAVEGGRIREMGVIKSSPCGAAYYLTEKLKGMPVGEAIDKSGLLTQFVCKGRGGPRGSLHKAAELHRAAIEKAISLQ